MGRRDEPSRWDEEERYRLNASVRACASALFVPTGRFISARHEVPGSAASAIPCPDRTPHVDRQPAASMRRPFRTQSLCEHDTRYFVPGWYEPSRWDEEECHWLNATVRACAAAGLRRERGGSPPSRRVARGWRGSRGVFEVCSSSCSGSPRRRSGRWGRR